MLARIGEFVSTPEVVGAEPLASARSRRLDWLLGGSEVARAEAGAQRLSREQRERLRRAKLAFEMGELALAPGSVVRAGSTAAIAANLFRQATYWALLSQQNDTARPSPAEAWAGAAPTLVETLRLSEAESAQIASAMGSTFVELGEGAPEMQTANAELLRRVARQVVGQAQAPIWQLEWAKLKRFARVSFLAVLVLGVVGTALTVALRKPDLAAGKPWRTSSVGYACHPERSDCGGAVTDIFFHTRTENNPWFEYDFGTPLAFSSLTIKNRSDFGPERAVPLVVEVSNDDQSFREIARRDDVFSTWRPSFPTERARYLRLRVPRESILHLEAVRVHP